jgi:hypothetical protein
MSRARRHTRSVHAVPERRPSGGPYRTPRIASRSNSSRTCVCSTAALSVFIRYSTRLDSMRGGIAAAWRCAAVSMAPGLVSEVIDESCVEPRPRAPAADPKLGANAQPAGVRQQAHAVGLPTGQRRVDRRHRPGVAVAVGRTDFGAAPRHRPRRARREVRIQTHPLLDRPARPRNPCRARPAVRAAGRWPSAPRSRQPGSGRGLVHRDELLVAALVRGARPSDEPAAADGPDRSGGGLVPRGLRALTARTRPGCI